MPVLLASDQAPTLRELLGAANTVGLDCEIIEAANEPKPSIQGLGSLLSAGPAEISFLSNPKLQAQLNECRAAAVIMTADVYQSLPAVERAYRVVVCSQPYLMYALLAQWFDQHRLDSLPTGIHPGATIADSAEIGEHVSIGPYCVIESGAKVGRGSRLGPGCIIGANSAIGQDCLLHARVTLYHGIKVGDRAILHAGVVLGADGFGFAPDPYKEPGAWAKIAQIGGIQIGNDVEIGANTTIDRGALEDTLVGNGVKLDNQIMIAHNVHIGDHTAMAACVGVAGSTHIGRRCTVGGASMISGHLILADDVHISGGTAITSNISEPGRYTGVYPFASHTQWQRNAAVVSQLAQLRRRVRAMEDPSL
ncbi:UDP-3-O-(3-hydroxymyristoyl)glucosamine N-acyltransferase [Paralcaligenes sp. KSB-10]|jgi:UDP-3-O-[3-hydroxymyristoyl] glucosamine N-acyltransferase|uniref:UDP-3-O-(3-hydroxymyristoyl)glucosamine N-acyltransferase n=1 Tax=Paralcaligenes sp. KSB-10 TaxID=2901142 RepID=UPI001E34C4B9|nr:UDP-3-O-(3-hydroxymyristoyl)glucosamine N-acyltransferase [Paralcaligenes sp. KSB-10]UHL64885.1 UDP-3-O-(3-hydroxymyristoyl)glucosamine N-acyltransferase [Paralcaligenes sp. KSB-10]